MKAGQTRGKEQGGGGGASQRRRRRRRRSSSQGREKGWEGMRQALRRDWLDWLGVGWRQGRFPVSLKADRHSKTSQKSRVNQCLMDDVIARIVQCKVRWSQFVLKLNIPSESSKTSKT